jgi:hypothetical protein
MTSIRKRRRQIARLAKGPAQSWPWVRVNRYGARGGFLLFVEPDPEKEREEFLRQRMAPAPDIEGPHRPVMRGELGFIEGIRFITSEPSP